MNFLAIYIKKIRTLKVFQGDFLNDLNFPIKLK